MRLRIAVLIAGASGFLALSYEILWYRVIAFMTRGIAASFGLLLAAYLGGLALGSWGSRLFCRDARHGGELRALLPLGAFVGLANAASAAVVPVFAWSAKHTDFRAGLGMVALGAALLGAVLPLTSHFGIDPDERAGARLSYVYLANIVGSALGSVLTGFVLLDAWPILQIARGLAYAGFGLSALLFVASRVPRRQLGVALGSLSLLTALVAWSLPRGYDRLYERLLYKHELTNQRFARVIETKSGVITVTDDGTVYGGGAYDGVVSTSIHRDRNGIVRALAIGALHGAPREVLMIGLSSGSWAQVVAHLPGVERLTVVEINPGYAELIAEHAEVRGLLANPKVTLAFDDGRRWLLRNPDRRFDLIVMNTTWHWRAHITNLVSREFHEIVRGHLLPGGVFYFNTTWSEDVLRTAASGFPHALRVNNFIAVSDAPIDFDRRRWRRSLEGLRIEGRPVIDVARDDDRELLESLLAYGDLEGREALLGRTGRAGIVTDDNMLPEFREPLRYPKLE
ncbi:MAG: fused MFS/spermidine synthase [Polyangiaceae bacterium]|nr:fused MFS/spermidine synthase [Polyangiaceae bacterium]MCE7889075.1 hypothetical protein [Sorangiineae bacterium PRO1]MCL4755591.1 fused MFS/spermidine synthase [Myxococcales bacterium]